MPTLRTSRRRAFTILELILALALGALLLAALYSAINIYLGMTGVGRQLISQSAVAQVVFNKFTTDISSQIQPTIPKQSSSSGSGSGSSGSGGGSMSGGGASGSGSGGGSMSGGSSGGSTGGGSKSGGGSSGSGSSGGSGSGSGGSTQMGTGAPGGTPGNTLATLYGSTATNANSPIFNLGIQGDDSTMTLFVSRFGKPTTAPVDTTDDTVEQPLRSDLRRVYYWCIDSGEQRGLYRQEVKVATSTQALTPVTAPNPGDDGVTLIAPEVRSVTFEYFDGANWQPTWDGTQFGADGQTPLGPPLAIAVTVTVAPSDKGAGADNTETWKTYRHVVAILTANGVGTNSAVTNNPVANSTTTGGNSP